ncbi:MAG: endo-1,4-beta-xylanase [Candidatus Brocadiia bacterium]
MLLALSAAGRGYADNLVKVSGWELSQSGGGIAALKTDAAGDALTVTITKPTSPFYMIQLSQPIAAPAAEGDRIRFSFRARSASGNPLRAVIELSGAPYDAVTALDVTATPEWREYSAESEANRAYASGELSARLQCGQQAGAIEFAAVRVENLGPDPKAIAARAAIEPAAVEERIRKFRTGDLRVVVRGADGNAVPGADVRVEMTRSEFLFGCNIFMLNPAGTEPWQIAYQKEFTDLLNYATLPFYYGAFEPERGKPQYERLEAMARWCRDHGIERKGHPLVWHEVWPRWAPVSPDEAIPLLRERVLAIIRHYRGLISYWDVLNEANNAANYADRAGEGAWIKRDGPAAVVATALGWAREAAGSDHDTLLYNDFNTGEENVRLLRQLQERNALPDAIGIQSHMHDGVWPLVRVWETCERFAVFNRPIHFTETTVLSSMKKPKSYDDVPRGDWPTTPEGEAAQAEYVEKFYALLFSHPAVQAITWWDFSDRGAWRNAPSGLVREDMSPKPAYEKLHALIRGKWWTNAGGKSDAAGTFSTRAFYGDYRIIATSADGRRAETAAHFSSGTREPVEVKLP